MSAMSFVRSHSHTLLCSLLVVAVGFIGAVLYQYHSQQRLDREAESYGQALADIAARQAIDATLNQDMISLQVIVRELNRQPGVIGATVHDVENRLLVQAGHTPGRTDQHYYLIASAGIALHNHIAGYLRLTLSRPENRMGGLLALWALVILAGAALPWLALYWQAHKARQAQTAEPEPESEPEPVAEPHCAAVRLSLYLENLESLYNQLTQHGFEQVFSHLEQNLRAVLALYGGQRRLLWDTVLVIDFTGHQTSDCTLRALCSAHLLERLSTEQGSPRIHLSASIQALPDPRNPSALEQEFTAQYSERRHPPAGVTLIATRLIEPGVQQYAEVESDSGQLLALRAPYSDMLERQYQQLRKAVMVPSSSINTNVIDEP